MNLLLSLIDFIIHIDDHLQVIISTYGTLTYGILFLIVFCETGLVVTPFLPGDSLIFAAGAFAATGVLRIDFIIVLLLVAAILGDAVNYAAGRFFGQKAFERGGRIFKRAYLEKTQSFYTRYGGKTIIIARFVPIVRTFAPFVAGVGGMSYRKFAMFNVTGAILWVIPFSLAGYLFGNVPVVKDNFSLVIIAIILLSLAPAMWEWIKHRRQKHQQN